MSRILMAIGAVALLAVGFYGLSSRDSGMPQGSETEEISYAVGYSVGRQMSKDEFLDMKAFQRGIEDGRQEIDHPDLTPEKMEGYMKAYKVLRKELAEKERNELNEKNLKDGEAFRAEYANSPDAKTLEDGIVYKVIEEGSGAKPRLTDKVKVHYRLTQTSGNVLQDRMEGEPVEVDVANTILGWQLALKSMAEGSTWEIVISPELAYGERGVQNHIGPGETLIFQVKLVEINTPEKAVQN